MHEVYYIVVPSNKSVWLELLDIGVVFYFWVECSVCFWCYVIHFLFSISSNSPVFRALLTCFFYLFVQFVTVFSTSGQQDCLWRRYSARDWLYPPHHSLLCLAVSNILFTCRNGTKCSYSWNPAFWRNGFGWWRWYCRWKCFFCCLEQQRQRRNHGKRKRYGIFE